MKQIIYFEHYPHYMGTVNSTIRFTPKQFENLINLAKAAIKENKASFGGEGPAIKALEEELENFDRQYALTDALLDYFDSPRRPATIMNALKKKGVWSGEWEEGSFAIATTEKKAHKAVAAIEAKHAEDEYMF